MVLNFYSYEIILIFIKNYYIFALNIITMELNPLYETIITDLLENQYAVCDAFFSEEAVQIMRSELEHKFDTS